MVCTHGDFIVLPQWETRPLAPGLDIPFSHIILALRQPVLVLSYNAEHLARKRQVSIWFNLTRHEFERMISHTQGQCSTNSATTPGMWIRYVVIGWLMFCWHSTLVREILLVVEWVGSYFVQVPSRLCGFMFKRIVDDALQYWAEVVEYPVYSMASACMTG